MKRKIGLVVLLLVLLTTWACTKKEGNKEIKEEKEKVTLTEYEELAKEVGTKILQGDPTVIQGKLSENALKLISEKDLETAIVGVLGTERLQRIESITAREEKENLVAVAIKARMTNTVGQLTVFYNEKKEIEGIYYNVLEHTKKAFTADEDEKVITIGKEKPLEGFLKRPKGVEKAPLVIFVHGSGPQDRNETTFENTPFKDIAEDLAAAGIASIRYDKRTYAYREDFKKDVNIYRESLDDLYWILENLDKFEGIDPTKVFVLGHSQGGMLLPKVGVDHPEVKGLIMMAGSIRSLVDIWYDQAMDMSNENQREKIEEIVKKMKNKEENGVFPPEYLVSLEEVVGNKFIKNVKAPMLILQGEEDFQVYFDKDYKYIQEFLGDTPTVTFHSYPGLNHMFMKDKGIKGIEAYKDKARVDSQVTSDIVEWIKEHL